ncbi:MAG: DoxX family protein [Nanoarchaeota archaeon]|nr:DoxX family protein [Nanoarchaeota archaeon]
MKKENCSIWAYTAVRVLIGLMFVIAGYNKLMNPSGVEAMLSGMSFFAWAPGFWAWVLLLSELIFGLALVVGYKVKYSAWPLVVIMVVAWIRIISSGNVLSSTAFLHLITAVILVMIAYMGTGKLAISKD